MKQKLVLLAFTILLVSTLLLQGPIKFRVSAQDTENIYDMPPDIDCIHIVEDTNFTEAPTHGVNGTSDEFSTSFHTDITSEVYNYVELKWEHPPGFGPQIREDFSYSDQEPASWDYAYFSTTFEWSEESLPVACLSVLDLEVETTGDFSNTPLGQNMFQLSVMLIDANGKFARIHSEEFLNDESYGFYSNQLSSWVIEYAWEDLIEDDEGNQIAPNDIVEVRVALSPSFVFYDYTDPEFEGSVSIRCRYFDIQVLADIPPESISEEPLVIGSAGVNTSINYVETVKSPNGTLFTLGRTYLIPDWGVIVRWDENAHPLWIQEWSDDAPAGIAADDERIYTVGQKNNNISLAIWSYEGELLEEISFNMLLPTFGLEVSVFSTGQLCILGYNRNQSQYTSILMVLNSDYSVSWDTTLGTRGYITDYQLHLLESGFGYAKVGDTFYQIIPGGITRTTMEYNAESFLVTNSQDLWCTMGVLDYTDILFTPRRDLRISQVQFGRSGTEIHTTLIRYKYSSSFYDSSWHSSIAIDDNEEYLYTLALKGVKLTQFIVVKTDLEGEVSWTKSIENGKGTTVPYNWKTWYEIQMLDNDMIYVVGTDLIDYNMNLTLAIFDFRLPSWTESIDWLLIGVIAGVVVVADIGLVYYMKQRKKPTGERPKVDLDEIFDEVFEKS